MKGELLQGFLYWGDGEGSPSTGEDGGSPPPAENLIILLPPGKIFPIDCHPLEIFNLSHQRLVPPTK